MERKMLDYLPDVLRPYTEYQGLCAAQQKEFDKLWDALAAADAEQYIATASRCGVARWEMDLGIAPNASDTLEDRRFRIRARMNEQPPFTMPALRQRLTAACGEGNYTVALTANNMTLRLRVDLAAKANYNDVVSMLQRVTPANILLDTDLLYNTHEVLSAFTHEQLAAYTHDQMRGEKLG